MLAAPLVVLRSIAVTNMLSRATTVPSALLAVLRCSAATNALTRVVGAYLYYYTWMNNHRYYKNWNIIGRSISFSFSN